MDDFLCISFDFDEKNNEKGLCVGRLNKDGSHTILKVLLDDKAGDLYQIITDQATDYEIKKKGNGHWVKYPSGIISCSECGGILKDDREQHKNFCNRCGADMRGKEK